MFKTSFLNFLAAWEILYFTLPNFLTNFIFDSFNPIKSSITKTCPSQFFDDPIPIVGIFNVLVISFASVDSIHSKTIEKTPFSCKSLASF